MVCSTILKRGKRKGEPCGKEYCKIKGHTCPYPEQNHHETENRKEDGKAKECKVVAIRRQHGVVVQDCDVYIGRRMTMGGWNLPESKWKNPYSVKEYGIEKSLELFETYLRSNKGLMKCIVEELDGRILGCWCVKKGHEPCHGKILIKIINELK